MQSPTDAPTPAPTSLPTKFPTLAPSQSPSTAPTGAPTRSPTTSAPTLARYSVKLTVNATLSQATSVWRSTLETRIASELNITTASFDVSYYAGSIIADVVFNTVSPSGQTPSQSASTLSSYSSAQLTQSLSVPVIGVSSANRYTPPTLAPTAAPSATALSSSDGSSSSSSANTVFIVAGVVVGLLLVGASYIFCGCCCCGQGVKMDGHFHKVVLSDKAQRQRRPDARVAPAESVDELA